jgi:hypothetical protein
MKPYQVRNQKTASVADEVLANIAEYAAMESLAFETATLIAKNNYWHILKRIKFGYFRRATC